MIKRLLIANRGEIAVRIIRSCAEMGIKSIAIYSDADRNSLHVKKADEAYRIGTDPLSGYLSSRKIVRYALLLNCDAIHPGYGFLSENPELARRCEASNVIFIGPKENTIAQLGDKLAARKIAQEVGANPIPGSDGVVSNYDEAISIAKDIGYPIMLKAAAGGGGRGIRMCNNRKDIKTFFPIVHSEALNAFGNGDIFIEKCILNPKHIEVQIMGDKHGDVVHLFDRDCSIQRRNQKLIEIAPSPQLTDIQRDIVCRRAVKIAVATNYESAGTVEFLMDKNGDFYFLEMNSRIQVEHPVTEQITGIDLIQEQISIANGNRLSMTQAGIVRRGYAMEFRINAEDPSKDFLPSFGKVSKYYAPGGPGVRTDSAIYTGYEIPPYYDSLCAKVITWALDWDSLLARGKRTLRDINVSGIKTTLPYYINILDTPEFKAAKFDTSFVANHPELTNITRDNPSEDIALALAAALTIKAGF